MCFTQPGSQCPRKGFWPPAPAAKQDRARGCCTSGAWSLLPLLGREAQPAAPHCTHLVWLFQSPFNRIKEKGGGVTAVQVNPCRKNSHSSCVRDTWLQSPAVQRQGMRWAQSQQQQGFSYQQQRGPDLGSYRHI